jgi:hypothetical protein
MTGIAIVSHRGYGHTARLAEVMHAASPSWPRA